MFSFDQIGNSLKANQNRFLPTYPHPQALQQINETASRCESNNANAEMSVEQDRSISTLENNYADKINITDNIIHE